MDKYTLLTLALGELGANCYILICGETSQAAVIDPGAQGRLVKEKADAAKAHIAAIINTHGHWDHIGGNAELQQLCDAPIMIHEADAPKLSDPRLSLAASFGAGGRAGQAGRLLRDNDVIEIGGLRLKVLHTPGHTPGGISLLCQDLLFTGDTLFKLSIGRSDLPGGDEGTLLRSIHEKFDGLDPQLTVLPGHGPASRLGFERECNPFLRLNYK